MILNPYKLACQAAIPGDFVVGLCLVLTISFTTYLTRPVSSGRLRSWGRVVHRNRSQFIAESVIYNSESMEIGGGNGVFVRSKAPLNAFVGYGINLDP